MLPLNSSARDFKSVLLHPTLLAFSCAAAFAALAPSELVAKLLRNALLVCVAILLLDIALTKYHLWQFTPMSPQEKHFALITGASSGIGKEMAFQLAAKSCSLIIAARNKDTLQKVKTEIEALYAPQVQVETCACDLSTSEGIHKLIDFVNENKFTVDILINNAGASWTSEFLDLSDRQVDELLTLNVISTTKLSHAIVPQMVARGVGHVLNIASMSAAISIPTAALYGSSKSFVLNLSQAMSYELRGTGVTVTCACPGPVHTNFGSAAHCDASIYMNTPGLALDVKECARRALASMFSGDTDFYDTLVSRWGAALFRTLLPTRLGTLIAAVILSLQQRPLLAWFVPAHGAEPEPQARRDDVADHRRAEVARERVERVPVAIEHALKRHFRARMCIQQRARRHEHHVLAVGGDAEVGAHRPGQKARDRHPGAAQFVVDRLAEVEHECLGAAIERGAGQVHGRGHRADVEDAADPAGHHLRRDAMDELGDRDHVEHEDLLHLLRTQVHKVALDRVAGVVHEDVDDELPGVDKVEQLGDALIRGQVARADEHLDRLVDLLNVGAHDLEVLECDLAADAQRSTGHERIALTLWLRGLEGPEMVLCERDIEHHDHKVDAEEHAEDPRDDVRRHDEEQEHRDTHAQERRMAERTHEALVVAELHLLAILVHGQRAAERRESPRRDAPEEARVEVAPGRVVRVRVAVEQALDRQLRARVGVQDVVDRGERGGLALRRGTKVGLDWPRAEARDRHARAAQLVVDRLAEAADKCLGAPVETAVGHRQRRRDRRDVEDSPHAAPRHLRGDRVHELGGRDDVEREQLVHFLGAHLDKVACQRRAGVIHEDVDNELLVIDKAHERVDARGLGQVARAHEHVDSAVDLRGDVRVHRAQIQLGARCDRQRVALLRELDRDLLADARGRAGHERIPVRLWLRGREGPEMVLGERDVQQYKHQVEDRKGAQHSGDKRRRQHGKREDDAGGDGHRWVRDDAQQRLGAALGHGVGGFFQQQKWLWRGREIGQ